MAKKEEERQSLEVSSHDPLKSVQSEIRGIEELSAALQCREKKSFCVSTEGKSLAEEAECHLFILWSHEKVLQAS